MGYTFFGTSQFSIFVLEELEQADLLPACVITAPDRPKGRGHKLTPSLVADWAAERGIETLKPEELNDEFYSRLTAHGPPKQLFVVASYGKIIPKAVLDIPEYGALNVHPSLLPLYRGPSPIQSQIIGGPDITGVSIMQMDEKMDHGPIVAQIALPEIELENLEKLPTAGALEETLARAGGQLLAETMPEWVAGNIDAQEQDHEAASYTQKFTKEDARIDINGDPEKMLRKIKAFTPQPGAYFYVTKNGKEMRVKITDATIKNGALMIMSVIPEGKREMPYADFAQDATHLHM